MRISFKITLLMILLIALAFGITLPIMSTQSWNTARDLGLSLAQIRAHQVAAEMRAYMESAWYKANTLASTISQFESISPADRRAFLDRVIRTTLEDNLYLINTWIIWDANMLDGSDQAAIGMGAPGTDENGRFVPTYTRTDAGLIVPGLARDFHAAAYYILPRQQGRQIITDVSPRMLAGETRNPISFAAPVRDTAGQIVGIVGVDIGLRGLNSIGQGFQRVFEGTLSAAFSSAGTVVSHADDSRLGMSMLITEVDILGPYLHDFFIAVTSGSETYYDITIGGANYRLFNVPVFISEFPDAWSFGLAMPMDEVLAGTRSMIITVISIALLIFIIVAILAIFVSRSIAKPIVNMAKTLNDIAHGEGDLTARLPETGGGEILDAARYFNQTFTKIRELVILIKGQTTVLSEVGNDLASNMTETAAVMNEISSNIKNIKARVLNQSASVVETNATMEQVTSNITRLGGHVERQTEAVSTSSVAIEQMMANIQSVSTILAANAANVKELQESAEIGRGSLQDVASDIQEIANESEGLMEINGVMENIASQTNLLSMNAAIEAAHAGDAGRGFAVVADEIRKLAESSSEQSKTIGDVLKKIKESIDKISLSTSKVMNRFEAIDKGVRTVAEQEEVIRNAMEEQNHGSRQILTSSGMVSEITNQVKTRSEEMLEGSKEVIHESKNLERVTQEITVGMNEMAAGSDQVTSAVLSVNDLTGKTRESIASLADAVARFKV